MTLFHYMFKAEFVTLVSVIKEICRTKKRQVYPFFRIERSRTMGRGSQVKSFPIPFHSIPAQGCSHGSTSAFPLSTTISRKIISWKCPWQRDGWHFFGGRDSIHLVSNFLFFREKERALETCQKVGLSPYYPTPPEEAPLKDVKDDFCSLLPVHLLFQSATKKGSSH